MSGNTKIKTELQIGELSERTGVKAGTIRFYERCGFLSPVKRLPNGYRVFGERHVYQIRVCRLVFGGYVNKHLRKLSMDLITAAREWDRKAYQTAAAVYLRAVEADIEGTQKAVDVVTRRMKAAESGRTGGGCSGRGEKTSGACSGREERTGSGCSGRGGGTDTVCSGKEEENDFLCAAPYSKKQAAAIVGVTTEAIRNWERNGLLGQPKAYEKRYYPQEAIERMYVIRLLLNNGYSMMAIKSFFAAFDRNDVEAAVRSLTKPGESETLIYQADRYLETLLHTREKAEELYRLSDGII